LLKAIDMHVHILTGERAKHGWPPAAKTGLPISTGKWRSDPDGMAEMYQSLEMMAVIFDVDGETRSGVKIDNGETAAWMMKYPNTFIGFGSVDPWKGKVAVSEVERCADMGLHGMKFQQAAQGFDPTNERFFPIYEAITRLNLPVIFHTGTTAVAAGSPGGKGIILEYCKPIPYIDNLAARFPEMRIIMAHRRGPGTTTSSPCCVTRATRTWTFPAGRRNTSLPRPSTTSTRWCRTRLSSAPTSR
jgi:predicted TIM-barrel fold metal-dependent hydrolase